MKRSELSADFILSAAFDYDCKALDGSNDPMVRSYENIMYVIILAIRCGSFTRFHQEKRVWNERHERTYRAVLLSIHSRVFVGPSDRQNAGQDHESDTRKPKHRAPTR